MAEFIFDIIDNPDQVVDIVTVRGPQGQAGPRGPIGPDGQVASLPLPVLQINTNGVPILDKETWVPAVFTLNGLVLDGDIRGRGNSTWTLPKKPWNIKLDNTTSLLGMTGAKRWSLLANYIDYSMVHNAVVMEMGRRLSGLDWTPASRYVEVYLNDVYQGMYQLFEPVRMETGRVNLTAASGTTGLPLTGAYLAEIDAYRDGVWFNTAHDSLPIVLDTPDGTGASGAAQVSYLQGWLNNFETALYGSNWLDPSTGYAQYIDRDSFIDWYLLNETVASVDAGFFKSCKLYKTRDAVGVPGKLFLGPLWDYDISLGAWTNLTYSAEGWWVRSTATPVGDTAPGATWIVRMLDDPDFKAALVARWAQLVTLWEDIPAFVDTVAQRTAVSRKNDDVIWGNGSTSWRTQASSIKTWLATRISWITANINSSGVSVPNPVSHFDFHEGSGLTTTSLVGGYVLTASAPTWKSDGIRGGGFTGIVGPNAGALTEWTAVFEATPIGTPGFIQSFGNDGDNAPWFNIDGSLHPGPWPPNQFATAALTTGVRNKIAYVFKASTSEVYVNGVLSGTFANTSTTDLQNMKVSGMGGVSDVADAITLHDARFWNVALTADQIAAI